MKTYAEVKKDGLPTLVGQSYQKELYVSTEEITNLQERVKGVNRASKNTEPGLGRKMCPTRHGCQGATDCNYSYANYPG